MGPSARPPASVFLVAGDGGLLAADRTVAVRGLAAAAPAAHGDPRRFRSDLVALVLVVIWVAVMNGDDVKMQFDALSYDPSRRADWVGAVQDSTTRAIMARTSGNIRRGKTQAPEGPQAEPGLRRTRGWPGGPPELHDDEAVLNNWRAALWRRTPQGRSSGGEVPPTFHPKLAVVCTTGGASREQYWTALLLDRLGHEMPEGKGDRLGFHDGVCLVTGASGGMVGAAYYLVWRDHVRDRQARGQPDDRVRLDRRHADGDPPIGRQPHRAGGHERALVPRLALSSTETEARCWSGNGSVAAGRRGGGGNAPPPVPLVPQREGQGEIPSVVFTPVTVDDGRRLLISNLGLEKIAVNGGEEIGLTANRRKVYSVTALEFFRVFGKEGDGLTLATAAQDVGQLPDGLTGGQPADEAAGPGGRRRLLRQLRGEPRRRLNLPAPRVAQAAHLGGGAGSGPHIHGPQGAARAGRPDRRPVRQRAPVRHDPLHGLPQRAQNHPDVPQQRGGARASAMCWRGDQRDDFFATVIFENSAQVLLDPKADDGTWPFWRARRRAENAPPVTDVAITWLSLRGREAVDGPGDPGSCAPRRPVVARGGSEARRGEPGAQTDSFLQRPDPADALARQDPRRLHDLANVPGNEPLRAFYIKELERALNYERLQALKSWWGRGY